MKRNLVIASLSIFLIGGVVAQNFAQKSLYASLQNSTTTISFIELFKIQWKSTEFDFGQIKQNVPVTAEFMFTNTGSSPLIVKSAVGSCGCTVAEFPKQPIPAGKSGIIKATFNAANVGTFTKTVTVETNAETSVLTLKGEVSVK
jgi:hypothetical protein